MEEKKNTNQPNKVTYDELKGLIGGLQQQNDYLKQQNDNLKKELNALRQYVSEQQTQSIFAYLNGANKIIENSGLFGTDFLNMMLDDIKRIMLALRQIIVPENKEGQDGGESTQAD